MANDRCFLSLDLFLLVHTIKALSCGLVSDCSSTKLKREKLQVHLSGTSRKQNAVRRPMQAPFFSAWSRQVRRSLFGWHPGSLSWIHDESRGSKRRRIGLPFSRIHGAAERLSSSEKKSWSRKWGRDCRRARKRCRFASLSSAQGQQRQELFILNDPQKCIYHSNSYRSL